MDRPTAGIILASFIVFGLLIVLGTRTGRAPAAPQVGSVVELQPPIHIPQGSTEHPPYNSNPPTSGWHWPQPASPGIYTEPVPDEAAVHNLEHGYVWITYHPSLAQDKIDRLGEIARRDPWKIIVSPREANDAPIALASWGRIEKLTDLDEERIVAFIRGNRNRGPEKTPN